MGIQGEVGSPPGFGRRVVFSLFWEDKRSLRGEEEKLLLTSISSFPDKKEVLKGQASLSPRGCYKGRFFPQEKREGPLLRTRYPSLLSIRDWFPDSYLLMEETEGGFLLW